jgi:hypothetical protein
LTGNGFGGIAKARQMFIDASKDMDFDIAFRKDGDKLYFTSV